MTLLYLALVLPLKKFYFNKYFIRLDLSPFTLMKYFRLLYLERNSSCLALMAPLLFFLIKSTASSYFIPSSINAVATNTGALRAEFKIMIRCCQWRCTAAPTYLPSPVTQWTPTHVSWFSLNSAFTRESHRSMISWEKSIYSVRKCPAKTCVDWRNALIWTSEICLSRGGEKFVPKQLPE